MKVSWDDEIPTTVYGKIIQMFQAHQSDKDVTATTTKTRFSFWQLVGLKQHTRDDLPNRHYNV